MKNYIFYIFGFFLLLPSGVKSSYVQIKNNEMNSENSKTAVFAGGCFWCTEAVFSQLKGVKSVVSGYSGGKVANPTYEQVCSGRTGHAECTQITYDPDRVTFAELLEVFWMTHDPTTLNRQGADSGTQYRSAIFYLDEGQKQEALSYKAKLEKEKIWNNPIVTEIVKFEKFYPAEDYHQEYYENNPNQGYCRIVITPKVDKFRKIFKDKLKVK
jgi:peptide-methionine (S)-S-oxide reductase